MDPKQAALANAGRNQAQPQFWIGQGTAQDLKNFLTKGLDELARGLSLPGHDLGLQADRLHQQGRSY